MQTWAITFGGDKRVLLDDLSEDDFVAAARAYQPDTNWLKLYQYPASHPGALYELISDCAVRLELAVPDRPTCMRETVALTQMLELVDDDLPRQYEDGIPLETPDDPETTISSTSTELEDGIPT